MSRLPVIAAGFVALAGCAPTYAYLPAERANATVAGRTGAFYEIPEGAPEGDVRIASFGLAKMPTAGGETARTMHVRLVVANDSRVDTWTIDTRQQLAELRDGRKLTPGWARTDEGTAGPLVRIGPQEKRTIDLYFPLPPDAEHSRKVPEFDVVWHVQAGARYVTERTPFQRFYVEPPWDYGYGYGYGYGWPGYPYGGPYGRTYSGIWGPPYGGVSSWWW